LELLKSVFGETSSTVKDFEEARQLIPKQRGPKKSYSCPDGHEFSSTVSICPHCGKRAKENSTKLILLRQIAILSAEGWMLPTAPLDFFDELDPDIRRVSEGLFKDRHYGESVSTAFKELNHQVKQEYTRRKGAELDGADLMHTAFSPKNPVFVLADQSKESGRNTQQGFMELFAGSMIGIRNPHAHENLTLDPDKAKHFLYLASLLMKTFKAVR